jgi:single-stranded-DNA-specific exonuclease
MRICRKYFDKSFHEGIVGLIAGRLKEKYNKPVVVLTDSKEGEVKGSARSIDPFHVKNAFDELNYLLLGYGGHAKAAGLSLKKTNLELFEKGFIDLCTKQLNSNDFVKKYNIDLFIKPEDINIDLIDDLQRLEPFGEGFNKPLIALSKFNIKDIYYMGEEQQHIKFLDNNNISLIMWNGTEVYRDRGEPLCVRALGYPEINVFRNKVNYQFMVCDDNFCDINLLGRK